MQRGEEALQIAQQRRVWKAREKGKDVPKTECTVPENNEERDKKAFLNGQWNRGKH